MSHNFETRPPLFQLGRNKEYLEYYSHLSCFFPNTLNFITFQYNAFNPNDSDRCRVDGGNEEIRVSLTDPEMGRLSEQRLCTILCCSRLWESPIRKSFWL